MKERILKTLEALANKWVSERVGDHDHYNRTEIECAFMAGYGMGLTDGRDMMENRDARIN